MSSSLNGWRYDVMRFESREPVDLDTWERPIKLNRKELKREPESRDGPGVGLAVPIAPMLGADGKPVIGTDGKIVMVSADGKPIHGEQTSGPSAVKPKEKSAGRKKFQKKTKQVFLVPEATRQLRKEERYPWVMEDGTGEQIWVAMLEHSNRADNHAMFLPTVDNVFKFVPPHRWYKFQKKSKRKSRSLEEVEKLVSLFAGFYSRITLTLSTRWLPPKNSRTQDSG
jgi:transcription initiation factor TFIIF subunit alpha